VPFWLIGPGVSKSAKVRYNPTISGDPYPVSNARFHQITRIRCESCRRGGLWRESVPARWGRIGGTCPSGLEG
jgi:hypothetical protein